MQILKTLINFLYKEKFIYENLYKQTNKKFGLDKMKKELISIVLVSILFLAGFNLLMTNNVSSISGKKIFTNYKMNNNNYLIDNNYQSDKSGDTQDLMLISGDRFLVKQIENVDKKPIIFPSDQIEDLNNFHELKIKNNNYLIPKNIDLEKIDIEFFNIDYLIENEYYKLDYIPVIIELKDSRSEVNNICRSSFLDDTSLLKTDRLIKENTMSRNYYSIANLVASKISIKEPDFEVESLISDNNINKIWLDRKVDVCLDESVPIVGADLAHNYGFDGENIEIAILDTGINSSHPDLDDLDDNPLTHDPKVVENKLCIPSRENKYNETEEDVVGHGTHCASIAAGTGAASDYRYTGIAPKAKLWNVKVLGKDGGYISWIISGIEYAAYGPDNISNTGDEADIVSMSLGPSTLFSSVTENPLEKAINNAIENNVLVVVASGNDGSAGYYTMNPIVSTNDVISVGASTKNDELAYFSGKGPSFNHLMKPDLVAPGYRITAADAFSEGYVTYSGTSMACPHVAGAASLVMQAHPDWNVSDVKDALTSTANPLGYNAYQEGAGRLNVSSAVSSDLHISNSFINFGVFTEFITKEEIFYIENLNQIVDHEVSLKLSLYDIHGNIFDFVKLNETELIIPAGCKRSIKLTVNTTNIPKKIYYGRISITSDLNDSYNVMFGISGLNKINISTPFKNKDEIKLFGIYTAYTMIFSEENNWYGFSYYTYLKMGKNETEIGSLNSVFYLPDGVYHIYSCESFSKKLDDFISNKVETNILLKEDLSIIDDCRIIVDSENTVKVDFNPGRINQIVCYNRIGIDRAGFGSTFYDGDFRISPNEKFNMTLNYQFHPKLRLFKDYMWYLSHETKMPSFYVVRFNQQGIKEDTTFKPDYNNFIKRETILKTPQIKEGIVNWGLFPFVEDYELTNIFGFYFMNPIDLIPKLITMPSPYKINVFLQAEPVKYIDAAIGMYENKSISFMSLNIESYGKNSNPTKVFGEHPFKSGLRISKNKLNETNNYITLTDTILEDAHGNNVFSGVDRTIWTIIQDGNVLYDNVITEELDDYFSFKDTSKFEIIAESYLNLSISSKIITKIESFANLSKDSNPPDVYLRCLNNNLYNRVITKDNKIQLVMEVQDESSLLKLNLQHSADNGKTWKNTSLIPTSENRWIAEISVVDDTKLSFRTNAIDLNGNSITQTVIDGVHVSEVNSFLFKLYQFTQRFPLIFMLVNKLIK